LQGKIFFGYALLVFDGLWCLMYDPKLFFEWQIFFISGVE
jgi:hypothetical protein